MNLPRRGPTPAADERVPWWRVRMMWLVVGGPLLVVVAATVTAVIAARGADEVLPAGRQSIRPGEAPKPDTPAVQARNHVTTPGR